MSRIIIKNLPQGITEERLISIFGTKGQITDVQLKYTKDGQFRRFGFIGYYNESDAAEAIAYFDKSRINTAKISVQECTSLGSERKPESDIHKQTGVKHKEDNTTKELLERYKDDPLFEEFLAVHSAQKAQQVLQLTREGSDSSGGIKECEAGVGNLDHNPQLDKDQDKIPPKKSKAIKFDLFTLKLSNLPYCCKKRDVKDFLKPIAAFSIRIPRSIKGIAFIGFKDEKKCNMALLKNRSILKGKQVSIVKYERRDLPIDLNINQTKWRKQDEKPGVDIAESGRIFVRNLSYATDESAIREMFEKFGPIANVNLPIDATTKRVKGFALVTFVMPEHAVKAYSELDGQIFHGRMLHLLPGAPKMSAKDAHKDSSSNYKLAKANQQRAQASSSAHNWNALFLGHDAVADIIATSYGTTKEAVLAPHASGSAAVRLALGETQLVAETRKYLECHGVCLDAFNSATTTTTTPRRRSKTTILVKNLPANTSKIEIKEKFDQHGEIARFLYPPNGITAIVEFIEPSEARKAFCKLAYTKFKGLPLYLEWAPESAWRREASSVAEAIIQNRNCIQAGGSLENASGGDEEKVVVVAPEAETTIYVKNVDFQTTDGELREHFKQCGEINYANIVTKKDPSDSRKTVSMGYGFVRFQHKSSADMAIKSLQHSKLAGKALELKRSERTLPNDAAAAPKQASQTGSKILIRNIPFQANSKEVLELFKTFGAIKALRLPKNMVSGTHRGFAFVDFTAYCDAQKAFDALSQSTHLYGRRLVLEWAQKEEDVAQVRKRTAAHFRENGIVKSKKSTIDIDSM